MFVTNKRHTLVCALSAMMMMMLMSFIANVSISSLCTTRQSHTVTNIKHTLMMTDDGGSTKC